MESDDDLEKPESLNPDLEAFDEFNDDTFGAGADTWDEEGHEELAKMTEEEIHGLETANDFFELGADDVLDDCLEPSGSETINGGQEEVMRQMQEEMAALRTTASPLVPPNNVHHAIQNVMPPSRPNLPGPVPHIQGAIPSQPQMAPRPEFVDPAIMSMGSMPLPPPPSRAVLPAEPPKAPPQSRFNQKYF